MKAIYRQKLLTTHNSICNVLKSKKSRPKLLFNFKVFAIIVGKRKSKQRPLGACANGGIGAIYINPNRDVKKDGHRGNISYSDYLYTLIHELTHYYFPKLSHGFKFEQKIGEIFQIIPSPYFNGSLEEEIKNVNDKTTIQVLCPKCKCLVRFGFFDDTIYDFKDPKNLCRYCLNPFRLIPCLKTYYDESSFD